ncbi:phosphoribosylformylglycinamidine synthase [Thermosipho melanesiensis]|uniref:Phosphoribosylformylglycinamidine synthase subunit PurQ n=2 Tax=Thermosipho melanesiensis TaxID=46541 RepID=A6LMD7_THEM4|nr:phosphoribosylformylglycinamidine synthase subunit PurQ [Thermosipho melanesiensis]ABR31088.1 phosphoribosylformylglycinamidine synthase I [Thermosipho melanesiensis BI429]APT74183.1 phosphoribosylformylglycinamidine synthase [Thermosipho melanesiensis]OOC36127.1 phosphoribosylformylglycinamidine synthase [Thermosipho melanesiensis]OOC36944.1 phosphoribosylformylglycinamidine synthase [Thermosipho melanesiensis]OOC37696.1 phosphoribosylformylglycinamidine synthase [Thermosipho melanesiensis
MRAGVIVYPGSNCDRDAYYALELAGFKTYYITTRDNLDSFDLIILPGGFSYGDYLRPGAVSARESLAVKEFAENGGMVIGICNGFQILVEMGLLSGALLQNDSGKFICKFVELEIVDNTTPFTMLYKKGEKIRLPVAHGFGRYVSVGNPNVVFKYKENINGSDDFIAGIYNGNVLGMMPHPERAVDEFLGSVDGLKLFKSVFEYIRGGNR